MEFPHSVINQAKQLTTISLPKGLICEHHFQAFVDKNLIIRGYQKVDYEFKFESNKEQKIQDKFQIEKDEDLFENLTLEGNYLEYYSKGYKSKKESNYIFNGIQFQEENSKLKQIYEEFWEFIDDDNPKFKNFIVKDKRRENQRIIF